MAKPIRNRKARIREPGNIQSVQKSPPPRRRASALTKKSMFINSPSPHELQPPAKSEDQIAIEREFQSSPELQREFLDAASYAAYVRADRKGQVKHHSD